MSFHSSDRSLFFSKNDPSDQRFGDLVRQLSQTQDASSFQSELTSLAPGKDQKTHTYVLAGYPDDEGVNLNGGRLGAHAGPINIRRSFYKLTPSVLTPSSTFELRDLGDLEVSKFSLKDRHVVARNFALATLTSGARWIGLGGGHDYAYADGSAYLQWMKDHHGSKRPLIINFDAHLDVRPISNGLSSGTSFYRLLEEFADFDFAEIGIQSHCNARSHLSWAKAKGARVLFQDELITSGESLTSGFMRILGEWATERRPVFVSVDIDGFSSMAAPGCSQSWTSGFMPDEFFRCFETLLKTFDVPILGIYEVSPPLDDDDRTSKLASLVMHKYISSSL